MECPRCGGWNDKPVESDYDGSLVISFFVCDCGCQFYAIFIYDHCEVLEEPPEPKLHYQSEYERDNLRDNIIERS